jgi:hypothetical protein
MYPQPPTRVQVVVFTLALETVTLPLTRYLQASQLIDRSIG